MVYCWTLISKPPWHSHIWDNVNQATLHKDIWIPSTYNDLVMDTPTLDSITTTLAHAFSTPTKVRKFDHTPFVLHNLSKYVFQRLLPLQALHMSQYHDGIPSNHISRWHISLNILQASSIWSNISHTCESSYFPQRHQLLWMIYSWTCQPFFKSQCFLCLLMSETQVPFICLQPKIQERATRHTPIHWHMWTLTRLKFGYLVWFVISWRAWVSC